MSDIFWLTILLTLKLMGNDWLTGMLFQEEQRIHIQGYAGY